MPTSCDRPAAPPADGLRAATCPRCGGAFGCGVAASAPCFCAAIRLTPAQLAGLRERYADCLCRGCLEAVAREGLPEEGR